MAKIWIKSSFGVLSNVTPTSHKVIDNLQMLLTLTQLSTYCELRMSTSMYLPFSMGFPGGAVVKILTSSVGDARDMGSILGCLDPLEEEMTAHSGILTWRIPWIEEPTGL